MYPTLLLLHSFARWAVLILIVYSIYRAAAGLISNRPFAKTDNAFRHWTATAAHIQLMIGMLLYTQSPLVSSFWHHYRTAFHDLNLTFYGLIHSALMLAAIVLLTIGSAMAKRKPTDVEKFRTMLVWFSVALLIIFIAIPWPFSPLSGRPYLRTF
ncbi:hypothetical protein [Parapedobacter koreensis]|uniref:Cytochrome B n=1 Tax=Parapedobacter koreensis TaxID=332977 RepID=A0A1H7EV54_9SPHI|nr:hypothetical protein [Parapedobacter koreensis]SEK17739.1 hypothetical protein SAMN05421740_10127 [Parapedobacter koreensis]